MDIEVSYPPITDSLQPDQIILLEVSDFQCPYCADFALNTLPEIRRRFSRDAPVVYSFVNFPLESIHPMAFRASEAAGCAGREHKFWEMHDLLFRNQSGLDDHYLRMSARRLNIDANQFVRCMDGDISSTITADIAFAKSLGVTATPTIFIGLTTVGKSVRLKKKFAGNAPYARFEAVMRETAASRTAPLSQLQ